ncbi:alginate O-acetyltransferase AlgX-related protein [Actinokineospora sp.]|uniref:alginate O-acetyltransferase AlgX-related protein n=1 Tax=Actinokineospora sp. TaxID=1872133 RepID=UPI004037BA59
MTRTDEPDTLPPIHEAWLPREHSLHRPRHGGRQRLALFFAAVFFTTPLVALGLGVRPPEIENRPLAAFPSPADGWNFLGNLSPWATDHLAFRHNAIGVADAVSRSVFGEPPALGGGNQSAQPDIFGSRKEINDIAIPSVIEGRDGWLYLGDDVVSRCKQSIALEETLQQLRTLRDGVVASGREFVLVVAPDKTTVVPENLPDTFVGQDCARRVSDNLWRLLTAEDFVVDLRDELRTEGARLGKPVYPPLDAHWADEGGVAMARGLAEAVTPGVSTTWQVTPRETWRVPADLPPLIGRAGNIDGRYYALRPDGGWDQTRVLPQDFSTPVRLDTAVGPGTVEPKAGLLGDSFSIRALRYLAASFRDLTVLHYGKVDRDGGRAAGRMLAENDVVMVEIVERTLASGNTILLKPEVVAGIVGELSARPVR